MYFQVIPSFASLKGIQNSYVKCEKIKYIGGFLSKTLPGHSVRRFFFLWQTFSHRASTIFHTSLSQVQGRSGSHTLLPFWPLLKYRESHNIPGPVSVTETSPNRGAQPCLIIALTQTLHRAVGVVTQILFHSHAANIYSYSNIYILIYMCVCVSFLSHMVKQLMS